MKQTLKRHFILGMAVFCQIYGVSASAATNEILWHEPGVDYYCDQNPRIPLAVHVVRIDRSQKDLELRSTLGGSNKIGMAILSEQVKFASYGGAKPLAGINGDYFNMEWPYEGDPMNLQILPGGELVSGPGDDRAFFYLDSKGVPHVTNVTDQFSVTWPDGKTSPLGLNQSPDTGQAVLYTTAAGLNTRVSGVDLILENAGKEPWLPIKIGQTYTARIRQISKTGYSAIPQGGVVLSLSPKSLAKLPPLTNGMVIKISTATDPDIKGATMAIGGGPSLLKGGKLRDVRNFHGFQIRNPRTALGWNDKYYYFIEVDGRQPRYSMGMTLEELGNYFIKLECTDAINLDGGGSCTTWVGGKIVNSPSQRGRERPSANALVLVRVPSGGAGTK